MTTRRGWRRSMVAMAALAAVGVGCTGTESIGGGPGTGPVDIGPLRLIAHDSCAGLLDWFHTEASARVGPYGLEGSEGYPMLTDSAEAAGSDSGTRSSAADTAAGAAPPANDGSSTTNTQEPGVGEPDLAWTDGTRLLTVVTGRLEVVDLGAGAVTASIDLAEDDESHSPVGLLVEGDHAVVIERGYGDWAYDQPVPGGPSRGSMPVGGPPSTRLVRIDLGDNPTVVGSVSIDADYVDARMVGGIVRAVVRSSPTDLGFVYPAGSSSAAMERAAQANRDVVADSTLDDWLPSVTVAVDGQEGTSRPATECPAVDHPAEFGGFDTVTVVALDLGAGAVEPLPGAAVVADAETVYASTDALYVATTRYPSWVTGANGTTVSTEPSPGQLRTRTDVHAFSLPADAAARYEASGSVPGTLLDQFALSEHEGDLRVATTVEPDWSVDQSTAVDSARAAVADPTVSESRITVLRRQGTSLDPIGEVTGLGPTEQIRGVRFAGPQGYVVTFRQTDPLYVVDLSDPTAPVVAGELKIPGYSSYLQILDQGRVLGLGQDATDRGRTTGFQQSLFDVSDPTNPTRVAQLVVPDAHSLAETDHHALLWWAPEGLLAVPVENWGVVAADGTSTSGVLVSRIVDTTIEEVGTITHPASTAGYPGVPSCPPNADCTEPSTTLRYPTPIVRTLVAGGRLVSVSTAGVKVSTMATLADEEWIAFR